MTRRRRTLLDAIADKLVELVDDYDVSRLLEARPKKKFVELKIVDVKDGKP